jgi:hypothetical protein
MLAIEYSTREFFNTLNTVQWEWLLATIILTGKVLTSRLESRSHVSRNSQARPPRLSESDGGQAETRNPKRATRNS